MFRLLAALPLIASCAPAPSALDAVARWHGEPPLEHISLATIDGHPSVFVAVCDWEHQWRGTFGCFGFANGAIAWAASLSDAPTEPAILSARGFTCRGFAGPLVEVLGITHAGDGSLYLYVLEGRHLRLLLKTRAVDCHWGCDGLVFADIALTATYRDVNGDGRPDVSLTGTIERLPEDEGLASWPCAKVFLQHESGVFVEDASRRLGFEESLYDW